MYKILYALLIAMLPIVEARGAIPISVALGLNVKLATVIAIIGNMIPVPFVILFSRKFLNWLNYRFPMFHARIEAFEKKIHIKGNKVKKYQKYGLFLFVAIPLPGTGAWTGAIIASFLDIRLKNSILPIFLGVIVASIIVSILTYGVASIL